MSNLKKNFAYNIIYQLLLIILPFILSPYISRVLGAEGLGLHSYTYSIASGIAVFGMLGVNNYGNRSISVVRDDRSSRSSEFWNIWFWQFVLTIVTMVLYLGYLLFLCKPEYRLVSVIECFVVMNSMLDINWFFFGMEKFKLTVTRNVIIKILSVVSVFLFVKTYADVWLYTIIIVGSGVISNLVLWTMIKHYVEAPKIKWDKAKRHFASMVVLFIPVIAVSIYQKMDKIMLGSFSTILQSGYYENIEKIINIPKGVITALGTVMLPRMSYLVAKSETKLVRRYIKDSMEFVLFSSSAMAFGIAAVADDFAPLFFGEHFASIGPLIQVMAITVIFVSCANVIRTQYLIPNHRDIVYIQSVWVGAIVNFLINMFLIPRYGAWGAVLGTVAAEGSVMICQAYCVRQELDFCSYIKSGSYYMVSGAVMYMAVSVFARTLLRNTHGFLLVAGEILAGAGCYLILCVPYIWFVHRDRMKTLRKQV